MKHDIKVILFDFDGTLINSVEVYRDILLELGSKYGSGMTQDDFLKINGMGNKEAILLLLQRRKIRKRALLELLLLRRKYKRRLVEETRAYPHAQPCLVGLSQKYRLAIVTSGRRAHVDYFAQKFNFAPFIEEIISYESVVHRKPDPEPYLKAAQILGVHPTSCLIVEDSPQGVLSGKRAGMKTCAILHTTPRSYFVDNFTPDSFLENLNALTEAWL